MLPPSVSVVIPCFNPDTLLVDAVSSVLAQGAYVAEVILVNDQSPDSDSLRFLSEAVALSEQVRVIDQIPRAGAAAARNLGVRHAKSALVAFLDADDKWLPGKLEKQLTIISQQTEPLGNCWYSASNVICRRGDIDTVANQLTAIQAHSESFRASDFLLAQDGCLQTSSIIAPRELLLECPFDSSLRRHQDWDLLIRMQAVGACLVYIEEPLSIYNLGTDRKRISLSPNTLANTLYWFRKIRSVVPDELLQIYFFNHLINRTTARKAHSLLCAIFFVISLKPFNGMSLFVQCLFKAIKKLRSV
jgi:glycosyltransferase involved in cell wall biosynthesis